MHRSLKLLIWLYFLLLIFEGSLRKWWLAAYSDPLLVVRDPVVVLIYLLALRDRVFPFNGWIGTAAIMALASVLFSFLAGQNNLVVMAFGLRTNFLHLPLIWVMAAVLDRRDVSRLGLAVLALAVANAILMVRQFNASPLDWINKGVGEELGGQLDALGGRVRPAGFFSFTTGVGVFVPLAAAFVLERYFRGAGRWWPLLLVAAIAVITSIPVSINRTAFIATLIVGAAGAIVWLRLGLLSAATVRLTAVVVCVAVALSFLPVFDDARAAFMHRWDAAATEERGGVERAVYGRMLATFTQPFGTMLRAEFFGAGIGVGSNVGARLLYGKRAFLLAEDDWGKTLLELGPLLGLAFIAWRIGLTFQLGLRSWRALTLDRNPTPLILLSAASVPLMIGQWAQATNLGFAVFGAGLALAACNPWRFDEEDDEELEDESEDAEGDDEVEARD